MSLSPEQIAKIAHEVNRAYCQAIGDFTIAQWDDAPDWQKDSAIDGVNAHLADPSMSAEQSHAAWKKFKESEGWVYGPVKNPETKEHPCMVPYDQLPLEQRVKDYLFKAVVSSAK